MTRSHLELKRVRCKISYKGYLSLNIWVIFYHSTDSSSSSSFTSDSDSELSEDEIAYKRGRRSKSKEAGQSNFAMEEWNAFIDKNEKMLKEALRLKDKMRKRKERRERLKEKYW